MTFRSDAQDPIVAESRLVDGLKAGEDRAYEELVRAHGGRLLQVARRFLGEEEARDAVQDAFLSAFKSIRTFDGKARLSTWLHRVVVNCCLMRLRKSGSRKEEPIEPLLPTFLEDGHRFSPGGAWSESAEELVQRSQIRDQVRRGIARLPRNYRTVLLLRDIEELDGAETAELLEITPNAVKVRLHRARQALREVLDGHLREVLA